ncbi:MAG: 50S ribosomal protein L4 [Alphaproteobacteria bacterium]|nr:50S ribosomal protein L4 [Alphaproteobacteria bacterium]
MKVAVRNLENKDVGEIALDDNVFGVDVREDILHRVIHWQLNKRRSGTHKTKGISEVSGTNQKPWRQKGTGRARAGSTKRPQDVGGGIVFGPVVRSHATDLPKKIRALALKIALSAKAKQGKLVVIEAAEAKDHKTKPMASAFKVLGLDNALVLGGKEIDVNFARATANLPRIDVLPSQGANVYDIMRRDTLVLTKEAVSDLTERLKG